MKDSLIIEELHFLRKFHQIVNNKKQINQAVHRFGKCARVIGAYEEKFFNLDEMESFFDEQGNLKVTKKSEIKDIPHWTNQISHREELIINAVQEQAITELLNEGLISDENKMKVQAALKKSSCTLRLDNPLGHKLSEDSQKELRTLLKKQCDAIKSYLVFDKSIISIALHVRVRLTDVRCALELKLKNLEENAKRKQEVFTNEKTEINTLDDRIASVINELKKPDSNSMYDILDGMMIVAEYTIGVVDGLVKEIDKKITNQKNHNVATLNAPDQTNMLSVLDKHKKRLQEYQADYKKQVLNFTTNPVLTHNKFVNDVQATVTSMNKTLDEAIEEEAWNSKLEKFCVAIGCLLFPIAGCVLLAQGYFSEKSVSMRNLEASKNKNDATICLLNKIQLGNRF